MWKRSPGWLVLIGFCAAAAAQAPDLPPGPMRQKARTACLECHDSSIIVQQRLERKTWQAEVEKMIRWGAVVAPAERDTLTDYFFTNFNPNVPPYVPPRPAKSKKPKVASLAKRAS